MACYDVDRFRDFVVSEGFNAIYDIPADERARMRDDDVALMQFGFRFLRQVLFGENSIAMRPLVVERRRAGYREKLARLEREAAERRVRDTELMDEPPDT